MEKVHRIGIFGSNVFIIETDESLFMIDAGYPKQEKKILDILNLLNKKLKLIILTHAHFDHFGCAAVIKKQTGALIAIHESDAQYLCKGETPLDHVNIIGFFGKLLLPLAEKILKPDEQCADIILKDGDTLNTFGLNASVIHTPGHTPGSISIIVNDSLAFVGDLITNTFRYNRQRYYASDWGQINRSIEKLREQKFELLYVGHRKKVGKKDVVDKIVDKIRKEKY